MTDSPPWFFMSPGSGRRGKRPNYRHNPPTHYPTFQDYIDDMKAWIAFQEEQEKKKKDADKDKKKPPTQVENFLSFIQMLSLMVFIGLPVGLVALKMYNSLFKWALLP